MRIFTLNCVFSVKDFAAESAKVSNFPIHCIFFRFAAAVRLGRKIIIIFSAIILASKYGLFLKFDEGS